MIIYNEKNQTNIVCNWRECSQLARNTVCICDKMKSLLSEQC